MIPPALVLVQDDEAVGDGGSVLMQDHVLRVCESPPPLLACSDDLAMQTSWEHRFESHVGFQDSSPASGVMVASSSP